MSEALPARPHLEWYRKAAKKKLENLRALRASAKLADAQLEIARELGFSSWRQLHDRLAELRGDELAKLAALFTNFAEQECRGSSPLYEHLARRIAADNELLTVAGVGRTPIPNLLFAAAHYLLLKDPHYAAAAYFASINDPPAAVGGAFAAFRQFVLGNRAQVTQLMRTRLVQTNEVARCAYLRPAFRVAWERLNRRPIALVEVGTSAGLNLCFDQYAFDYGDGAIRGNASSPVRIRVDLRGTIRPPVDDIALPVTRRLGLDLNPITADKTDDIAWLNALIWPEHHERRKRLADAITIAAKQNIEFIAGNSATTLLPALRSIDADTVPVVFQTHSINQFSPDARTWLYRVLEIVGSQRAVAFVSRHDRLTLDVYRPKQHEHVLLADVDAHGRWIEWKDVSTDVVIQPVSDLAQVFRDAAKAIAQRDLETVRSIVRNVPAVVHEVGPHPSWGGQPQLLHVAIEQGNDEIVRLLLTADADPSGKNDRYDGWSPLMLAAHWKRNAIRDLLIEHGVKIGLYEALLLADDLRATPLIDAFEVGSPAINNGTPLHFARTRAAATRLIERGVDIDAKDKYGSTPLDAAAKRDDRDVIDVLLKKGANASLETLARVGDLKSLRKSLGKKKPAATLLEPAIDGKHANVVRWLIAAGVSVNVANDNGVTPLHSAAFNGDLAIVKMLVKAGANVHAEDDEYSSTATGWAQHAAQNLNRAECVEVAGYLQKMEETLPKSAKPQPVTKKTATWKPIMDAAYAGDAKRIKALLAEGADPNIASATGGAHRPLHRAIEAKKTNRRGENHLAAVQALLDAGADPKLRGTYDRLTALQLAALSSPQFVPLLVDRFRPLDIFHSCAVLDLDRVRSLLKQDKSLTNKPDENNYLPIHYAAGSRMFRESPKLTADQLEIAKLLIEAGASPNATYAWNGPGNWPLPVLYMACGRTDNPAMTELLIRAGAKPYDNESVYHAADENHVASLAVLEKHADAKELAEESTKCLYVQLHWGRSRGAPWLLEHGADPNVLNPQFGNSALHAAVMNAANDKVLKLLLQHGGDLKKKNRDGKTAVQLAEKLKTKRVLATLKKWKG